MQCQQQSHKKLIFGTHILQSYQDNSLISKGPFIILLLGYIGQSLIIKRLTCVVWPEVFVWMVTQINKTNIVLKPNC